MRRRRLVEASTLGLPALALVGWPSTLPAQTPSPNARIAALFGTAPSPIMTRDFVEPFAQGLREAGFIEGRNLVIDVRYAEGKPERLPALLTELLAARPDLIVAAGPAPAKAAKAATTTLPIVAAAVDDPVLVGLAKTMARPGGNITGISSFGGELVARRLQLLKDFVPQGQRFAVLGNPNYVSPTDMRQLLDRLEPRLGSPLSLVLAAGPQDYEGAFADMKRQHIDGVVVLADSTTWTHRARLQELMLANRLPSVWGGKDYLGEAGLASYQSDFRAIMHRAGAIAAKVLNGANPAETPFEQATKLELVLNLKAARRLGIEVPAAVRIAADEIME